jgi:hypothetical protein
MLSRAVLTFSCLASLAAATVTVRFTNNHDQPVNIDLSANQGSWNGQGGTIDVGQTLDPAPSFELGLIGIVAVNTGDSHSLEATLFEPSFAETTDKNYQQPWMDVSMVNGYSVPMKCSCPGQTVGCNVDLWKAGGKCDSTDNPNGSLDGSAGQPGSICLNGARGADMGQGAGNGPANPFFQPCTGDKMAYTFDNAVGLAVMCKDGDTIECCIGDGCEPGGGSSGGNSTGGGSASATYGQPSATASSYQAEQSDATTTTFEQEPQSIGDSQVPATTLNSGPATPTDPAVPSDNGQSLASSSSTHQDVGNQSVGGVVSILPISTSSSQPPAGQPTTVLTVPSQPAASVTQAPPQQTGWGGHRGRPSQWPPGKRAVASKFVA